MTDDLRARAIALYDRFTHGTERRRVFMREMTALAGGVAAAEAVAQSKLLISWVIYVASRACRRSVRPCV